MLRYVHTNIIARDAAKLIAFYKEALGCKSIGQTRDLRGPWLDGLTGLPQAHITGEHLLLPGYDATHPTLEIFSYHSLRDSLPPSATSDGRVILFADAGGTIRATKIWRAGES